MTKLGLGWGSNAEVQRIYECLQLVVPASATKTLSDIVNAAWRADLDAEFWKGNAAVQREKTSVLTELTLKSVEVQEIEARMAGI
jgi:hypothetical protein